MPFRVKRATARLKVPRRSIRSLAVLASIASIVAGLGIAGSIAKFLVGSSIRGSALERQERHAIAAAGADGVCQTLPSIQGDPAGSPGKGAGAAQSTTTGEGLLEVPTLRLEAPVLQGTSDSVLGEAVGHDPASVWPGNPGTSVLSAHDVTWFSGIGKLKHGDLIRYVTPCRTYLYRVSEHHIVPAGSPVYTTAAARIVLDTCYPFNALYLTPNRYLVYADLISARPTHPPSAPPPAPTAPRVPAPPALAAQGLGLKANNAPLGNLTLTGTPSAAWRQSSAPLHDETAALAAYFGLIRSAEQGRRSWWADLAPTVPRSAARPLWRGELTAYDTNVSITLDINGSSLASATITAAITAGPAGRYNLAVTETVRHGEILVTRFKLTA